MARLYLGCLGRYLDCILVSTNEEREKLTSLIYLPLAPTYVLCLPFVTTFCTYLLHLPFAQPHRLTIPLHCITNTYLPIRFWVEPLTKSWNWYKTNWTSRTRFVPLHLQLMERTTRALANGPAYSESLRGRRLTLQSWILASILKDYRQ